MYIPPKEISFRLRGYSSGYVLYSRKQNEPTFFHYGGPVYDDQWWQLIPGTGKHAGYYLIKSKFTGNVIWSRNSPDPRIGHIGGNGQYEDNWFKFEPGTGKLAGNFRIRNFASDAVLYSRTHNDPTLYNYPGNSNVYDDQYFTFLFEDMEINRVEYKIDQAKILSNVPEVIGSATQRNDSSVNQTVEFNFSRTESNSSSFDYTLGFTITVGASGKVGIPFVAEGQVKVDVSNSHTMKWGTTTTESKTYSARFPATAPPHTKITATATVTRANIEVPFTIYSRSVATGFEVATQGIYHGVTYWNIASDIKEVPL
ncbi:hemolytic lectin [Sphaerosporella brunnea]|uniref:Hemolytic lectin n=1 Tax=Sphaerosporella brunnea TaxID=1250544 RepID=A0A5J5EH59_9PEZI|nr:hemolytic lectin [Sphaerosporella brunnea]